MRELEALIRLLAKLPGLGPRSARRLALTLIKKPDSLLTPLVMALERVANQIVTCSTCGNIDTSNPCLLCANQGRDHQLLCVVEEIGDLWALERSASFDGVYHVLGGHLSALDGVGPEQLNLAALGERVSRSQTSAKPIKEVILATNLTVEGQATAHYLKELLSDLAPDLKITRLAHGVPVGGELDYLDDGTLRAALKSRR